MYEAGQLLAYPFFRDTLQSVPLSQVLDSLTGLISRPYILQFIHHLIGESTPFTLVIIDLDNFKAINDTYGHTTGDAALTAAADQLSAYLGGNGLLGRFGGDEFLAVYLKSNDYGHIHDLFDGLVNKTAFRREQQINGMPLYLTATLGSAAFPENAQDYDSLFAMVDKALYRGKSKGRNCYIIYVKEKHEHLDISQLAKSSLCDTLRRMTTGFDASPELFPRLRMAFQPMRGSLHLHMLMYADREGHVFNTENGEPLGDIPALADGQRALSNLSPLVTENPPLCSLLTGHGYQSAILQPINEKQPEKGMLILCPEPHTNRIWQDEERAAAFFLARLLSSSMEWRTGEGETRFL